jgi:hypothetical protein
MYSLFGMSWERSIGGFVKTQLKGDFILGIERIYFRGQQPVPGCCNTSTA